MAMRALQVELEQLQQLDAAAQVAERRSGAGAGAGAAREEEMLFKGWRFGVRTGAGMAGEAERSSVAAFCEAVGAGGVGSGSGEGKAEDSDKDWVEVDGVHLSLPEMIFAGDTVVVAYVGTEQKPSEQPATAVAQDAQFAVKFTAQDALSRWVSLHRPDGEREEYPTSLRGDAESTVEVIKVPEAAEWARVRRERERVQARERERAASGGAVSTAAATAIASAPTAPINANALSPRSQSAAGAGASTRTTGGDNGADVAVATEDQMQEIEYDWTYSTDFAGTVAYLPRPGTDPPASSVATGSRSVWLSPAAGVGNVDSSAQDMECPWRASECGMDMEYLQNREVPILFYAQAQLYVDELHDAGQCQYDIKLRVMPEAWYLLARYYLRVDAVIVRVREARYFHRFGTDSVWRNVAWKESAVTELGPAASVEVVCNPDQVGRLLQIKETRFPSNQKAPLSVRQQGETVVAATAEENDEGGGEGNGDGDRDGGEGELSEL